MTSARAGLVHVLLVASGVAGLGYQVVITRMLSIGLGHEVFAVLAVVSAFFVGLAAGALALDGRIARSARPGLWYAGLEALIGLWALALIWLIPVANAAAARWIGPDPSEAWRWTVAFGVPAVLLLPATAAMGATLPAAERLYARLRRDGRGIGGLYAANAAGAMAGALTSAVWLAPALGFSGTLALFAALNLACAVAALAGPARGEAIRPPLPLDRAGAGPSRGLMGLLALTGFLGLGYEVAVVRALSQVMENTVYSFAAALAVYLMGTTLGAAAYQGFHAARRGAEAGQVTATLAGITGLAAAAGTGAVLAMPELYGDLRALGGAGVGAGILAELAAAGLALLLPAAAMGALFSHLAQGARGPAGGLGAAFAANTLGAALAPVVIGLAGIPLFGTVGVLVAISAVYLAVALALPAPRRLARILPAGAAVAGLVALAAIPEAWQLYRAPSGVRVHAAIEGRAATVTVTEEPGGARWLTVNGGHVMGGTASYVLDRIQGHFALMRHPAPGRALFLGVGTGATLAAAAAHDGLEVEAPELLPEVLALIPEFEVVARDLAAAGPRIALREADARRYVRAAEGRFDVILADTYHPAKDGAGLLYTVEHFEAVRAKLAAGGVFVQWLPLHQLDLATLRLITRSFLHVFPDARLSMGNFNLRTPLLALEGWADGEGPQLGSVAAREMTRRLAGELDRIGIDSPYALYGGFLAGPEALARFAGEGPLNTDDHPRVLFEAPRTVYAPLDAPVERLMALVRSFSPKAGDAVDLGALAPAAAEMAAARLEAYWHARNAFLALGLRMSPTGNPSRDIRTLGRALMGILAASPDFTPAYRPLVAMAAQVANRDPALALKVLGDLQKLAPDRPEAARLAAQLR